ncbi:hypothetical protein CKY28_15160 [Sphingomonas lenta]|uniref:Terminase n=1 Tax=Sphingomonas lenta TaxID=1141887 RepID=A0A2A2SDS8_9SPHN|nr:hypothetical protein CKY28_15160 [Sphingomonas lenta]
MLAALARTANARLALKECGISHYWAYKQRKSDPDFDARWRTAVRNGRRALAAAAAARARDVGAARPGEAARLTMVGSSGKGTLRLEREKPCSFTAERRARFLDALRATCNVKAAAAAVGVSPTGAYRCYHADAAFREAWEAALAEGRVHLEMALIGAARALFERPNERAHSVGFEGPQGRAHPVGFDAPDAQAHAVVGPENVTGMDAKVAMQLLRLHRPAEERGRARRWIKPADPEETRREILAKVAAVRAARDREQGTGSGEQGGERQDAGAGDRAMSAGTLFPAPCSLFPASE